MCPYLASLPISDILQTRPPLAILLEQIGFEPSHAYSFAKWLALYAVPTLEGKTVEPFRVCFQTTSYADGQRFLEWLSPPGLSPQGGRWIGEWDVEDESPPVIQVDIVSQTFRRITVIPIPTPWYPPIDRDTLWGFAVLQAMQMANGF